MHDSGTEKRPSVRRRLFTLFAAAALTSGLVAAPIAANAAVGATKIVSVYGWKYAVRNSISSGAVAGTSCWKSKGNYPAGYCGVRARLYTAAGNLTKASDTYFPSVAVSAIATHVGESTSGNRYSKGQTYHWSGDGYTKGNPARTPNVSG